MTAGQDGAGGKLPVLLNGLAVLRCFSAAEPLLGVTEIAERVGLHKSSVSRILATLEQVDLVERDPASRRFTLGLGVIELAGPLLADLDVRRVAYPLLVDLARRTGETAALLVWNGTSAVCVAQVASPHPVKHTTTIGTRYATAASASVQVLASPLPPEEVRRLLDSGTLLRDGISTPDYLAELATVRADAAAVNYGRTSVEEVGVAAGVFDHRGQQVAALLVSAPRFRVGLEQATVLLDAARESAEAITGRLGGRRLPDPVPPTV